MTSAPPSQNGSLPHNNTLEDAWVRFARYNHNANLTQRRFIFQRKLILVLGVAATTLAILNSVFGGIQDRPEEALGGLTPPLRAAIEQALPFVLQAVGFLVILVPIALTAWTAYTIKFNMGINWVMLRSSAELLKKEIFCYRMRVNEYSPNKTVEESREVRLARRSKMVGKRLMETAVNQFGLETYSGALPPKDAIPEGDDGFSDLTTEQYLAWRVEDQLSYYQRRGIRLSRELQRFQLTILLLGALSTLLAAFRQDIWLAVSSALAAALASFLEVKRVENNLISCNMAAADLYDIRTWWRSLSPGEQTQQRNIEMLVTGTESIIQSENSGWVQEMREALAEIYDEDRKKEAQARISPTPTQDVHIRMDTATTDFKIATPGEQLSSLAAEPDAIAPASRESAHTDTNRADESIESLITPAIDPLAEPSSAPAQPPQNDPSVV